MSKKGCYSLNPGRAASRSHSRAGRKDVTDTQGKRSGSRRRPASAAITGDAGSSLLPIAAAAGIMPGSVR